MYAKNTYYNLVTGENEYMDLVLNNTFYEINSDGLCEVNGGGITGFLAGYMVGTVVGYAGAVGSGPV